MTVTSPNQLFAMKLGQTYDAEHQFLEAQQAMLPQAHSAQVRNLLSQHIATTEQQIARLETIFSQLGQAPERIPCTAASGLVADGQQALQAASGNQALTDVVIADAQCKVEHSEIATYRGLVMSAQAMGQQEIENLLAVSLQEEEQTAQMVENATPQLLRQTLQSHAIGA